MDNRLKLLSDDQTAPKEGEKHLPEILCEHQEKEGDECNICHPPAKVEAGDALSPLIMQYPRESVFDALQRHHSQLKASLLLEKDKDEEIKRLKGLLERACIVLSSGIVGMPEEVRREARMVVREYIKAAVMGEQP